MKTKEEIEQLAKNHYSQITLSQRTAFKLGYTQCQEDNADKKYTLNDMKKACACGIDIACKDGGNDFQPFEDLINSLNK
jgi:5,10-methylene-tetrahydrofolate dehydrogenase/methenyl tetrahydrofolate cyclohydrolase